MLLSGRRLFWAARSDGDPHDYTDWRVLLDVNECPNSMKRIQIFEGDPFRFLGTYAGTT